MPHAVAVLAAAVLAIVLVPAITAHAAGTRPFALTITHVECVDDCDATGLEAALEGHADFYAKVWINGVKQPPGSSDDDPSTPIINNNPSIDPFWVLPADIPDTIQNVPITIQIWDKDDTSGDDLGDISPRDGDNNLDFRVSYVDGKWIDPTGNEDNVNWPQSCATGDGGDNDEPRVKVCFDVSTLATSGDSDGDGLLDGWERNGYNDDGDSTIDVNLPAMGAKVDHKDLFLELDSQAGRAPTHAGIQALKRAFAAAPVSAGSQAASRAAPNGKAGVNAPPNPDGKPGITLHVDTGPLVDTSAVKGAPTGSCSDGVDNGRDGLADGNDPSCIAPLRDYLDASVENPGPGNCTNADVANPECLVGDNLGGGNVIPAPAACGLDANYYAAKNANFNRNRRWIFRYAIMAAQPGAPTCTPSGGQGQIGGSDFAVFNLDAGTIMHELGHTLNLRHGGFQDLPNCKPNYVSVMNYDNQGGISRVGGGTILDYSPPRLAFDGSTRGNAPLPNLVESNLTEPRILDSTDPANRFVFVNTAGQKVTNNLNTSPDWDNDGDPPFETAPATNVDTAGPGPVRRPGACAINTSTNETIQGADDWTFVSLPFRQFGDTASGAFNVETDEVPTTQDLLAMHDAVNTTDLGVTVADSPDPVGAGTDLVYRVTVTNRGPNPAAAVKLVDRLPSQVTLVAADKACQAAAGTVTCGLGDLVSGASRTVEITVHVPADLVYRAGGPVTLANSATVDNLAGPDPNAGNDSVTETTKVVAAADLAVTDLQTVTPAIQVVIGGTTNVTVAATVANNGPSTPMNATVTMSATADAGVTVSPASANTAVPALAVGAPRTVQHTVTLGCSQPGLHAYHVAATVAPTNADDIDPDLTNNRRQVDFVLDCVVPVAINIKPGQNPNSISIPKDTVTVAVLTTHAGEYGLPLDFNAATIQPLTVHFGPRSVVYGGTGGATEVHNAGHLEDAFERSTTKVENVKDGDIDMVLHFASADSGLVPTDTEACVKGSYTDPATSQTYRFFGCDRVSVIKS